eukprot:1133613-Pelagomonas_calceolata.AAC.1
MYDMNKDGVSPPRTALPEARPFYLLPAELQDIKLSLLDSCCELEKKRKATQAVKHSLHSEQVSSSTG